MRRARIFQLSTVALLTVAAMILMTLDAMNRPDAQQGDTGSSDALDIGHVKPPGQYVAILKIILGNDVYGLFEKFIIGTPTNQLIYIKETLTTLAKPNQEKAASKAPTTVKHGKETADLAARLGKMMEKPKGKSNENLSTLAKPKQEEAASKAKLAEMWSSDKILGMLFKSSYALPIRTPPTHAKLDNASGSSRVKRSSESYVDWFYRVVWTTIKGKQTMG